MIQLQDLLTLDRTAFHTSPRQRLARRPGHGIAQITVPGGLGTTGLPWMMNFGLWLDPTCGAAAERQCADSRTDPARDHRDSACPVAAGCQPAHLLARAIDQALALQTLRNDMVDFYEANLEVRSTNLGFVFEMITIPPPPKSSAPSTSTSSS